MHPINAPQRKSHEVPLRDIFWRRFSLSAGDIPVLLRARLIWGAMAAVCIALFSLDPHGFRAVMAPALAMGVWLGAGVFVVGLKAIDLSLLARLDLGRRGWSLPLPLLSAPEFAVTLLGTETLASLVSAGRYSPDPRGHFSYDFLTFLVIETLFVRFIIPEVLNRGAPPATAAAGANPPAGAEPPGTLPSRIEIAGRALRADRILYISSEEHYLRVVMPGEVLVHRGKLGEAIAAVAAHEGVQPHRSWWISRVARPRIRREQNRAALLLDDGTQVPIARARHAEVQAWMDTHCDW
jgi:hypothetical protein